MKIFFFEDITPKLVKDAIKKLEKYYSKPDRADSWIFINSDGGDFESTIGLIDYIDYHNKIYWNQEAAKINTLCLGKAYSSAAFLLVCGHRRCISENSTVMFHAVSQSIEDTPIKEIKKIATFNDKHYDRLAKYLTNKCNNKCGNLFFECAKEEFYLDAEECLKLGIVDGIWNL